jgi:hypothetical protein
MAKELYPLDTSILIDDFGKTDKSKSLLFTLLGLRRVSICSIFRHHI